MTDNYDLNFQFPFTKVDQSRRMVTGIATADNIDPSGDIVDFDASQEAFDNWMGNIREMHQPKSVGKAISYKPVQVPFQGNVYDGIQVEAYISKGAEDTWQKVLDGTLRGFSVGGKTLNKAVGYDKFSGRRGQRITKYSLGELSLVDNPGNPAAMLSLIKRAEDGELEYALEKYDVFFCGKDNQASIDFDTCPSCDAPMLNIGEVAQPDAEIIRKFIGDYIKTFDNDLVKVISMDQISDSKSEPKENEMEKLLNNDTGDNVSDMDLTPEENSVLTKLAKAFFGKDEAPLEKSVSTAPVVVNVNLGEEISKAVNSVPKAKDGATPAKSGAKDPEDAADGGADEEEEDVNGEKVKKGTAGNTTKVKGGTETAQARPKTGEALTGAGSMNKSAKSDAEDAEDGGVDDDKEDADGKVIKKSAEGEDMGFDMEAFGAMLDEKLSKVADDIQAKVDEKIEDIQKSIDETAEKVEKVENSGALKKSVDADEDTKEDELIKSAGNSIWEGVFVPIEIQRALGYDS